MLKKILIVLLLLIVISVFKIFPKIIAWSAIKFNTGANIINLSADGDNRVYIKIFVKDKGTIETYGVNPLWLWKTSQDQKIYIFKINEYKLNLGNTCSYGVSNLREVTTDFEKIFSIARQCGIQN